MRREEVMLRGKSLVMVVTILLLGGLCFVFVIYGGLDKFRDPIQIIVPNSMNGLLCIRLASNSTPEISSSQLKYWVQENGHVEMDEDLLRSHRRKQFFRAADTTSPMVPVPDDEWFPIMTENDAKNGISYTVYWLGTKDGWTAFAKRQGDKPLCLSR